LSGSVWERAGAFALLSCDIFDTAVHQILARPEDVFLAVGLRAGHAGLISCQPAEFAVYRQVAERVTRREAEAAGHDEVRIGEIYDWLRLRGVVHDAGATAWLEFSTVCDVCRPAAPVQQALARQDPARLVFASDSALPGEWLAALLTRCGYGPAPRVFSSADLRLSKHTGRLFPAMMARLRCTPGDILHVGDNELSDVRRAREAGLAVGHLPRPRARPEHSAAAEPIVRLADSLARAREVEADGTPDPASDGRWLAGHAAPLLIGFSLFVLREARRRGITRLYFLARDGHLPLLMVQRLLELQGDAARHTLVYLHISRATATEQARDYLAASGFLDPGPRIVVDLGWRGSIQTALAELTGLAEDDLFGCYLGLWAEALRPGLGPRNAVGYVCSFGAPAPRAAILREGYVVLELIFSAPHGTVLRHTAAAPVHALEQGPSGEARRAAFAALEATCLELLDLLTHLQGGSWPETIDPDSALAPLRDLLTAPSREDVRRINRIPFIHGADGETLLAAVNPLPWHEALRNPGRALRRLGNAPWRAGAIRAALPGFVPFMPYDVLCHRVERVRRWFGL
jgi:FMN phosphatase YigB (HAD superfamily)